MQNDASSRPREDEDDGTVGADEPIPRASDDKVLEETARLAREGRKQLESDPKEPKERKTGLE